MARFSPRMSNFTGARVPNDTRNALQQDVDALKTAVSAKDAAAVTLELTQKQYEAGYVN